MFESDSSRFALKLADLRLHNCKGHADMARRDSCLRDANGIFADSYILYHIVSLYFAAWLVCLDQTIIQFFGGAKIVAARFVEPSAVGCANVGHTVAEANVATLQACDLPIQFSSVCGGNKCLFSDKVFTVLHPSEYGLIH